MHKNKYTYYWVIQGFYCGHWEDESWYDKSEFSFSDVRKDFREYCYKSQYSHRIINRRELNED